MAFNAASYSLISSSAFQFGKLLIQRLLLAKAVALRFRFHLIDATLGSSKRAIASSQFTAVQLATHHRGTNSPPDGAQRQRPADGARVSLSLLLSSSPISFSSAPGFHPPAAP